jgi:ADP-dependent phosphofructokinase/glucokinase
MQSGANGWALKQAAQRVWQRSMEEKEKKKPLSIGINENSFELVLRILGNEFIAIRIGSTNFSGKLIAGSILLLFFTFMLLEVFGLSRILGIE